MPYCLVSKLPQNLAAVNAGASQILEMPIVIGTGDFSILSSGWNE